MKYPNGLNRNYNTMKQSNSNRGMKLEDEINQSNIYYLLNNIAVIHKKPTPITIVKVDYASRVEAIIKEAYFKTPSTTDYNGLYNGKYLDFEAKETNSKTSFPISNIHNHQIKHLEKIVYHQGIGFLIVRFCKLNKTFLLKVEHLLMLIENKKKSIPLTYFEKNGYLIKENYNPQLDYLKIVDELYFGGKNYENKKNI